MTSIPPELRPPAEERTGSYECLADGVGELATGDFGRAVEWIMHHAMPAYLLVLCREPDGTWDVRLAKGELTPEVRARVLERYGLELPEDGIFVRDADRPWPTGPAWR